MDRSKLLTRESRTLFTVGTVTGLTDGELLDRYVNRRGDAAQVAFAALVSRHGPMVLGVCHRILSNIHDAEDAFQATFLVLIRKAHAVRVRDSLAPWLYGVSHRIATRARVQSSRRRAREMLNRSELPAIPDCSLVDREVRSAIDDELLRLPERYRSPVVLCDLEGLTHEEASRRLECPIGTIKSRLTRGRERLRMRLARRGLTLSIGGLGTLLCGETLAATVRRELSEATVRGAMKYAMRRWAMAGAFPAQVSALTEGVLRTMVWANMRIAGLVLLGALGVGMSLSGQRATAENRASPNQSRESQEPEPIRDAAERERVSGTTKLERTARSRVEPIVASLTQPKLTMTLAGPAKRYPNSIASYAVNLENTGKSTARAVRVVVALPRDIALVAPTDQGDDQGAFIRSGPSQGSGPLLGWSPIELKPGAKQTLPFQIRVNDPGLYRFVANATTENGQPTEVATTTEVLSMAALDLEITASPRVVDIDQDMTFTIKIKNRGSQDATQILIKGKHSDNIVVRKTAGTEMPARYKGGASVTTRPSEFVFPMIDRLEPDKEIVLGVNVKALRTGLATCRIYLTHAGLDQADNDVVNVQVKQPES